mmetsp:Transcript_7576/g.12765  ORF Transcript_7576/g.12765 Transcript_7576/m.12765 type:complete len:331 (+) Transcript_7576:30-1022(+)
MKIIACVIFMLGCSLVLADESYWCDGAGRQEQMYNSLNSLYLNTDPLSWTHQHLWGTQECPCSWYGVDCESDGNSTIQLNLYGNGISGNLVDGFCEDIYSFINLSNNEFFATLIDCIGDMTSLTDLRLSNNTFQGLPPASLGNLSNLKKLEIDHNAFAGPFPDYIECPESYFKKSIEVKASDNDFWCPTPDECDDCTCVDEPSDACTSINEAACDIELACCYKSSWNSECDDFVEKNGDNIECEDYPRVTCDESSSDSNLFWYILLGFCLVLCVFVGGWAAVCAVTFSKRDWRFKDVAKDLVPDDEMIDMQDEDLYYDGVPPRSSLDYEL